jgi:hypothetical protein
MEPLARVFHQGPLQSMQQEMTVYRLAVRNLALWQLKRTTPTAWMNPK